MGKRLLSTVFSVMLIFTSVDVTAFAQNTSNNISETETEASEVPAAMTTEESEAGSLESDEIVGSEEESGETTSETVQGTEEETVDTEMGPVQETEDESIPSEIMQEKESTTAVESETVSTPEEMVPEDSVQDFAAGNIAGGTIDNDLGGITWVIDADGKLTVSGKGEISTGSGTKRTPWYDYCEQITSAVIRLSDITDASYLLYECSKMTSVDVSGVDTSKVTNMSEMFSGCESVKTLNLKNFDTTNVIYMGSMFEDCSALTSLDVSSFNTANVKKFWMMFDGCKSLTKLDVSHFDTGNADAMNSMFGDCSALKHLDVSNFDTSKVTWINQMFSGCESLTELDVSGFDTAKVTDMHNMFYKCKLLTKLDVSGFDTAKVTDMKYMFGGCEALQTLDVSNFETSNVKDMRGMFWLCRSVRELDVSNFDTSNVTYMDMMFCGSDSITELDVSGFDTSKVKNMTMMFGCDSLKKLDVSNFVTTNVTTMSSMFLGCKSLTELDLSNFDTSNVTTMGSMFFGCDSLTELDLSNFDTSNVTAMYNMFCECYALRKLDISNFNTSNVTRMDCMFQNCDSLTELDLSFLDTTNVANMRWMFWHADKLKELDLGFDMSSVTNVDQMFNYCDSLIKIVTPTNLPDDITVDLPGESDDSWYRSNGNTVDELPHGLTYSIALRRNEIPAVSEDRMPPDDIYKSGIEINKNGKAYTTFLLKDNTGIIRRNRDIVYRYNGGSKYYAKSNSAGYVTIESPTLTNTTGRAEEQSVTAQLYLVSDEGTEELLVYDVTMNITVQPLSFTQKWEFGVEGSLTGRLDGGVGVKAGVVNAGVSLAKSELEGSLGGKMSVENEYENGSRNLTLVQNYNIKVASKNKIGIAAEAAVVGTGIGLDAISANGNAGFGGNVGIGLKVEDYNPDDLNDLKDIGKFLLGTTAQATGNVMVLQAAEALGFNCYNQAQAGTSFAVSAGVNGGTINFGNQKIGDLGSLGVNTVFSYTKSGDETDDTTKMKYTENIEVDESIGNVSLGLLETKVLSCARSTEDEITATINSEGQASKFSVKKSAIESGGILSESATAESVEISYAGADLGKLCSEIPTVDAFVEDRAHYILGTGKDKLYSALDKTSLVGEFQAKTEKKKISEVNLDFGLTLGAGVDVGVGWEGVSSYEYETAKGTYSNGQTQVTTTADIAEYVEAEKLEFTELVGEPALAIGEKVSDFFEDIFGKIEEGVADVWADVKGTTSDAGEWFVHLVSVDDEAKTVDTFQSYMISVYSDINATKTDAMLNENGTAIAESTASTVGDPYYVYVTDANDVEIADYASNPITLTLKYCDEMLEAAGVDESYAGNLAIYQYSEEYYGYTYLGGSIDAENKSVSINITSPGQYVLAVDTAAPVITSFEVSDASKTPTILVGFDELSGFGEFSMKIDGTEYINKDNWKAYYNGSLQRVVYPVTTELAEGSHTVTIYAVDGVGNAMLAPVTYDFVVDTIAPELTNVKLSLSSDKLRIRVWSDDVDVDMVTTTVSQTLFDGSVVESECEMDVMEGYYTGLVDMDENLASVTVTVSAKDIHGNRGTSDAVTRTVETLEENVENDLWVRFIDGEGENHSEYVYTGSAVKPKIEIYEGTTLLSPKKDYTVEYSKNKNVGQAVIKVTGKGNYKGSETVTFTINPKNINDKEVVIEELAAAENGEEQKPVPSITYNKKKLSNKQDKDFTVTYPDTTEGAYKENGTYTVHVKGNGNYTGEIDIPFMIGGKPASKLKVSKISSFEYTGDAITVPDLVVKDKDVILTENEHYTVAYKDNTEVGTASVVITGIAPAYVGTKTVTFKINGTPMKKAAIDKNTLPKSVIYDGKDHCPELTLTYKKDKDSEPEELVQGIHYDINYSDNRNAGTATILIKGKGRFTGTVKKTFKIKPFEVKDDKGGLLTVQEGIKIVYAKGGAKPDPVVLFGDTLLVKEKDYTLSYANNKAVTTENTKKQPLITVKFNGNFKGSKKTDFTIVSQSLTALDTTAADKVYSAKKNGWKAAVSIADLDGKKLKPGTDYEKKLEYFTNEKCTMVAKKAVYPAGTTIWVKATGKGNYADSTVVTSYDIKATGISKAKVKIADQIYTGKAITIGYDDITSIKVNGEDLTAKTDYVIVAGSYKNNIKKGTATVQLKGTGNYGGTITVKFKIKQKFFLWRLLMK